MKTLAVTLLLLFYTSLAYCQELSLGFSGGGNFSFANKHEVEYSNVMAGISTEGVVYHTQHTKYHISFTPKAGAYLQARLNYKANNKWSFYYAPGISFQRFHKHIEVKESKITYEGGVDNAFVIESPVIVGDAFLEEPKLGDTRLWHLSHQLGTTYHLFPRLNVYLSAWVNLLMQSKEYQMMVNNNYVSTGYQTNGASFRNAIAGLEAGVGYTILPRLELQAGFAGALSPLYRKHETSASYGSAYIRQLKIGVSYSAFQF